MSRNTISTARRTPSWRFSIVTLCGLYCIYTICDTLQLPSSHSSTLRNLKVMHQDLEFVHITKTGGTTIERIGCENGYKWGSMHYRPYFGCKNPDVHPSTWLSPLLQDYTRVSPWHTPPKILKTLVPDDENPFVIHNDDQNRVNVNVVDHAGRQYGSDKKLFTIVRNPYTRFVSEYYCPFAGYHGDGDRNDPAVMNDWIQKRIILLQLHRRRYIDQITTVSKAGGNIDLVPRDIHAHLKHFLNQVDYVYDDESGNGGHKIIDHVLHYENMEVEFNDLMKRYKLDITLPNKDEMDTYGTRGPKLSYKDLDLKSIEKINQWAGADFVAFGYKIITPTFVVGGDGGDNRDYDPKVRPLASYDPSPRSGMCDEFLWNRDFTDCTRIDE